MRRERPRRPARKPRAPPALERLDDGVQALLDDPFVGLCGEREPRQLLFEPEGARPLRVKFLQQLPRLPQQFLVARQSAAQRRDHFRQKLHRARRLRAHERAETKLGLRPGVHVVKEFEPHGAHQLQLDAHGERGGHGEAVGVPIVALEKFDQLLRRFRFQVRRTSADRLRISLTVEAVVPRSQRMMVIRRASERGQREGL